MQLKIKLVPNEDGLGPSMTLFYVARALYRKAEAEGVDLHLTLQNRNARRVNDKLWEQWTRRRKAVVIPKHSVIELAKNGERVDRGGTIANLQGYVNTSQAGETADRFLQDENLSETDAVICMGTPLMLRAAKGSNVTKEVRPAFEIFDHSWSLSLSSILHEDLHRWSNDAAERTRIDYAREAIKQIRGDEKLADRVYLLTDPIGPSEFYAHWFSATIGRVVRIPGVFGGWPDAERENKKQEFREKMRTSLSFPIEADSLVAFISGGGTPIWDNFLRLMLNQCLALQAFLKNVLFLFPDFRVRPLLESATLGLIEKSTTVRLITDDMAEELGGYKGDLQPIFLASDLILSRPGGITVQDAIACRTPIVCVVEPGQWQTEKIRENAVLHGVLRTIPYEAFQASGVGLVLDNLRARENDDMKKIMMKIENQKESWLVDDIAKRIPAWDERRTPTA